MEKATLEWKQYEQKLTCVLAVSMIVCSILIGDGRRECSAIRYQGNGPLITTDIEKFKLNIEISEKLVKDRRRYVGEFLQIKSS